MIKKLLKLIHFHNFKYGDIYKLSYDSCIWNQTCTCGEKRKLMFTYSTGDIKIIKEV